MVKFGKTVKARSRHWLSIVSILKNKTKQKINQTNKQTHNELRTEAPNGFRTYGTVLFMYHSDVIMGAMASQITSVSSVHSTVLSGVDQRKHRNSTPLARVRGIHRSPVNSHHKGKVTRTMFSFDDVMMDNFEIVTRQKMLPFTSRMRRDDINSKVQFKSLIEFVMQINCPVSDQWRLHKWHLKIAGIVCRLALKYSSVIEI